MQELFEMNHESLKKFLASGIRQEWLVDSQREQFISDVRNNIFHIKGLSRHFSPRIELEEQRGILDASLGPWFSEYDKKEKLNLVDRHDPFKQHRIKLNDFLSKVSNRRRR